MILVILELTGDILKSILVAQNFLHPNALYVFDKTFTLLFLFGMGNRHWTTGNKSMQWGMEQCGNAAIGYGGWVYGGCGMGQWGMGQLGMGSGASVKFIP